MKPVLRVAVPLVSLMLTACAPPTLYYREGAEAPRMSSEQTTCEIKALQQVPPSNQIRREPPIYFPGRRECNGRGDCRVYGGYWVPGEVYSVDVNANLRERAEALCMAEKGYGRVSLPQCPPGAVRTAAADATTRLPPLRQNSCAMRLGGNRWRIVTPGA